MYFDKSGPENTEECLKLAVKTAKERGIKDIVIASNSGRTAQLLKDEKEWNIVWVSSAYGFSAPGKNTISEEIEKELVSAGIKILTTTHVLSGAERGISRKYGGIHPVEIIADTLRMFGQGVKVCVEISIMALDAGLIPYGTPVLAVGGTGKGADTAVILRPEHANNVLETRIEEIVCKPREF